MNGNPWARLLVYVTGQVNQELLLQNEYLAAENRVLRAHLPARLRLSDPERRTLAEIGKRVGRKALGKVACVAKPDTILTWYRWLIARKFNGSRSRTYPGRPRIQPGWRNWWFASRGRTRVGAHSGESWLLRCSARTEPNRRIDPGMHRSVSHGWQRPKAHS